MSYANGFKRIDLRSETMINHVHGVSVVMKAIYYQFTLSELGSRCTLLFVFESTRDPSPPAATMAERGIELLSNTV
jgi:hypothetical protein